ncbi:MAG: polysaccharide biosynthesis/export family protein [Bacteroidota bacterium]|nr:polysaccharide biosynthesis/export family protein [Bacteroidota bacterium]
MLNSKITYFFLLLIAFGLFSCSNNLRYFKNSQVNATDTIQYKKNKPAPYTLNPGDLLTVKVYTYNEELNDVLSVGSQSQNMNSNQSSQNLYHTGYMVNDSGYIQLPVLGRIKVEGKSIPESRDLIMKRAEHYFNSPIINVKSAGIHVSFLGEFKSEGTVDILKERIDIVDAIAFNGGFSEYADKRNIRVIRSEKDKFIEFKIDLTDVESLSKEKFYVFNNDKIIADPVKTKIIRRNIQEYTFFLSAVTSIITTTVLIINLQNTSK